MVVRLSAPTQIATDGGDNPIDLPSIVLGGGVFGTDYNDLDTLNSTVPQDTLRLAFQSGINAVDTSPYYSTSEAVLGKAFTALADEFPRESYRIITKAGRYGRTKEEGFDYSPERVRASVIRSMELMHTNYLDGVYMHDVEFVSEQVDDAGLEGWKVDQVTGELRQEDLERWGLGAGQEGVIRGEGDEKVLGAMRTLFELKKEGLIRWVGFSGYPLPTLLRLARLVAHHLQPLDIMQSYSHHCLQNVTLSAYLPLFYAAGVRQVIAASPLSMGVLRDVPPPDWHPASEGMRTAVHDAAKVCKDRGSTLQEVSIGYGLTSAWRSGVHVGPGGHHQRGHAGGVETPTVVGLSTVAEVKETTRIFDELYPKLEDRNGRVPGSALISADEGLGERLRKQLELEGLVTEVFRNSGSLNWTWSVGV